MLHLIRSAAGAAMLVLTTALAAGAQTTTVPVAPSAAPPAPLSTPDNPPENPLVTARVTKEFLAWQRGTIDRTTYSPNAGGVYIDPLVSLVSADLKPVGAPQTTTYRTASLLLGDLVYRYDITGANGTVSVLYSLSQAGRTDSITFTPQIFRSASPTP